MLNKVTEPSSLRKPKEECQLLLQDSMERDKKKHTTFSPCKPVTSGSKNDVARNLVKVSQTKEGKKFMITTGV